jgi:DNA-directed RNA polymerase specialized sigma24 family protein
MGLDAATHLGSRRSELGTDEIRRERFGKYFPRLFAYAHTLVGDEAAAKAIVIDSFTQALDLPTHPGDEEFLFAIFNHARDLCRGGNATQKEHLSQRECEVIALLFDAQLSRRQICTLTCMKEEALNGALLKAFRKLRARMTPIPPAYLRAT